MRLNVAPTEVVARPVLANIRQLLDAAFAGDFTDDDWRNALGGMHVWIADHAGSVISHASVVDRTLVCSGHTLSAGYVEAVATAPADRRRGYARTVMSRVAELIRERFEVGALSTGAHHFYEALGWERWRGPTFVNSPSRPVRTSDDDGGVMILKTPRSPGLDLDAAIICNWRPGDVW